MKLSYRYICLLLLVVLATSSAQSIIPACDSEIYCHGPLLDAAQNARIYNDSKSFVDMKMNKEADEILTLFEQLKASNNGTLTDVQVKQFVETNFSPPNSEFENWVPEDWKSKYIIIINVSSSHSSQNGVCESNLTGPTFLSNITDLRLRKWAQELNNLWKELGRKITDDVKVNSFRYSFIPVENPIIVPGGRFREFYYWDTYWIMRGLLLSEMTTTVKGMLNNFLSMIENFSFVPNGGRIYYQRRSQPPFIIPMFDEYIQVTEDLQFVETALPTLEKEYNFWMENRSITISEQTLNYYASEVNLPRPESYREDNDVIKELSQENARSLMRAITSACESGWDFSTRWCGADYIDNKNVVSQLKTSDIIPVDLNSILAMNERILGKFHRMLGNENKAAGFDEKYKIRSEAIEKLLWNETDGVYYDYEISTDKHNRQYYASNLNPLWTKCFPDEIDNTNREKRMFQYLKDKKVLDFPGGIPTSLRESGEQWDFPNAWPPLVHMIIEGMSQSKDVTIRDEAFKQAQKWISSNYRAYVKTNAMFEKYDVRTEEGVPGSGGEYDVQTGFGWTNGVILSLLEKYGANIAGEVTTTSSLLSSVTSHPNDESMTTNKASMAGYSSSIVSAAVSLLLLILFVI